MWYFLLFFHCVCKSDQESQTAQRQLCPFCGKPFKRLKTHLPHCKMAPVPKETGSCITPSEPYSGAHLSHTASEWQTVTTTRGRFSDTNLTSTLVSSVLRSSEDTRLPTKAVLPNVKTVKKASLKKSKKSTSTVRVMNLEHGQVEMEACGSYQGNLPGDSRDPPQATQGEKGSPGKATDEVTDTQMKVKPKERDSMKTQQTLTTFSSEAQNSSMDSSKPDVAEVEGKAKVTKEEPHVELHFGEDISVGASGPESPSLSQFQKHVWAKMCVEDAAEARRATETCSHNVAADPGTLKVKPAVLCIKPLNTSDLGPETVFLHKLRPLPSAANRYDGLMLRPSSVPACRQTPPLKPLNASVGHHLGPSERCSRPAGLEWMPELALGYRALGLSLLPRWPSHTVHVQRLSPQIQPVATEIQGCLRERALMDVRLAELPAWLMSRPLLTPREVVASLLRGWQRYYKRYINVRRGGVSGVGMVLASYCVLTYMWICPRLKEERWRKYH